MKVILGWLAFGLGLAFAVGQYLGMARAAWVPKAAPCGLAAFVGFGLPMVALGMISSGLWTGRRDLRTYLGWTAVVLALAWGVSLLLLVAARTGLLPLPQILTPEEWMGLFCGFLSSMVACGAGGVSLLIESPREPAPLEMRPNPLDRVFEEAKVHRTTVP